MAYILHEFTEKLRMKKPPIGLEGFNYETRAFGKALKGND